MVNVLFVGSLNIIHAMETMKQNYFMETMKQNYFMETMKQIYRYRIV
jgi:hypothetical protein